MTYNEECIALTKNEINTVIKALILAVGIEHDEKFNTIPSIKTKRFCIQQSKFTEIQYLTLIASLRIIWTDLVFDPYIEDNRLLWIEL